MAHDNRQKRRSNDNSRNSNNSNNPAYRDKTFSLTCSDNDSRYLAYFMQNELAYYNHLVSATQPYVRSLPDVVLTIKGQLLDIWALAAETATNVVTMITQPVTEWPERFKPYATSLLDRSIISSTQLQLLSAVSCKYKLHPEVRRGIAIELMAYIQPQCEVIQFSLKSNIEGLRTPLQMLNIYNKDTKFSVQLKRSMVKITWDKEKRVSKIATPYAPTTVSIKNWDLTRAGWDTMIIWQVPADHSMPERYNVSVMTSKSRYIIDWTDNAKQRIRRRAKQHDKPTANQYVSHQI